MMATPLDLYSSPSMRKCRGYRLLDTVQNASFSSSKSQIYAMTNNQFFHLGVEPHFLLTTKFYLRFCRLGATSLRRGRFSHLLES